MAPPHPRNDSPVYTNEVGSLRKGRIEVVMRERLGLKVLMVAALTTVGLVSASPARADERLTANVPFDFIAGSSRFPAGNYVVAETSTSGVFLIASADSRHSAFVLTNADSPKGSGQPELVFRRYEGQNFLSQITDGIDTSREIALTPRLMNRERHVAMALVRVPLTAQ
jgi:hypothetical protein